MPSIVVTSRPSASRPRNKHDKIERPSTRTVHVPHSPNSHPCLVPVRARSSRRTSSSVLCGAKATSAASPLRVNEMCVFCFISFFAPLRLCVRHVSRQDAKQNSCFGSNVLLRLAQHHVINQPRLANKHRQR